MANFTPNYNLKKPLRTEYYNVADANGNSDIVDAQLKAVNDRVGLVEGDVDALELGKVDKVTGKGLSTNDYTTTEKNKLAGIPADTATQLSGKVDKVVGKQLSDENYTLIEKNKLAGVEENATADMTALEIKTEYESNADTNAYTDVEKAKVANLPADTNAQLAEIEQKVDVDIPAQLNEKANKSQEAWITPTLLNGWTQSGTTAIGYYKDSLGNVHLRGRISGGTIGVACFILPAGYRPNQFFAFVVTDSAGAAKSMTISSSGVVIIWGPPSVFACFDNLYFRQGA